MSDHPYRGDGPTASARRKRNLAIALALIAFVVLIFAVTMIRLAGAS